MSNVRSSDPFQSALQGEIKKNQVPLIRGEMSQAQDNGHPVLCGEPGRQCRHQSSPESGIARTITHSAREEEVLSHCLVAHSMNP